MKYRQIVNIRKYTTGHGFEYSEDIENNIIDTDDIDDMNPSMWYRDYVENHTPDISSYLSECKEDGTDMYVTVKVYAPDADPMFADPIKVWEAWESGLLAECYKLPEGSMSMSWKVTTGKPVSPFLSDYSSEGNTRILFAKYYDENSVIYTVVRNTQEECEEEFSGQLSDGTFEGLHAVAERV